jgi:hypothetical protein
MNGPTMSKATKPPRRPARPGMVDSTSVAEASPQARRQAVAILEVLAGVRRPSEAAQVLETSLPRYYQLERRALTGLLTACEPARKGQRPDPSRRIVVLEREIHRLKRECDRQQALVRAAERSLGFAKPALKQSGKAKADPSNGDGAKKRHLQRRPTVRALKAARVLQTDGEINAANGAVLEGAPSTVV